MAIFLTYDSFPYICTFHVKPRTSRHKAIKGENSEPSISGSMGLMKNRNYKDDQARVWYNVFGFLFFGRIYPLNVFQIFKNMMHLENKFI